MENPEDYAFQLSTKGYKLSDEEKRLCGAKVLIHSVTSSEAPSDSTWSWETDLSTIKSSGGTEGVIVGVSLGRSTDQQVKIKMAATRPQAKSIAQILQEDDIDDLISNVNDAVPVVAVIQKTARYYELRIDHQITGKALAGNGFHQRNVFFFAIFRNDEISAHDTRRRKWAEKVRTYGQQRQENLQQGDPLTISRPSKSLASPPRQESPEPAPAISNSITNGLEATLSAIPSDNNQYPSIVVAVFRLEAELSRDDGGPRDIDKEKGGEEGAEDDNGFTEHEASQFNDCYVELMDLFPDLCGRSKDSPKIPFIDAQAAMRGVLRAGLSLEARDLRLFLINFTHLQAVCKDYHQGRCEDNQSLAKRALEMVHW